MSELLEKKFLVKDHSGRGIASNLPLSHIREHWDMDSKNDEEDEWEDTLGDWLESADVGDTYFRNENNCSFTRTE